MGEQGLLCLVLTSFQPEVDVGVVAGCDSMQVEGGSDGGLLDGGWTTEL